jgi:hypothetical protein
VLPICVPKLYRKQFGDTYRKHQHTYLVVPGHKNTKKALAHRRRGEECACILVVYSSMKTYMLCYLLLYAGGRRYERAMKALLTRYQRAIKALRYLRLSGLMLSASRGW